MTNQGFSLVETLVVVGIVGLISVVLGTFQVSIFQQNNFLAQSIQAEQDARFALKRIVTELRQAGPSDTGVYPIALADKDKLTFYSDIDGNNAHERLRYFLSGVGSTTLSRGLLKPTGNPLAYVEANEQVGTVITNIKNNGGQIFSYYDKNYAGTSTPLTIPPNIPAIRLVKVSFLVDLDPNRAPASVLFESQVVIRSLKDNL